MQVQEEQKVKIGQKCFLRMYNRWGEKRNYKRNLIHISNGDEAGIKSISLKISGENAYGFLKNESGIHRLVRISPFDTQREDIQVLQVYGCILKLQIQ